MKKRLWFKAKLYGWGWYPATWEGWLCLFAYIVLMMFVALRAESMYSYEIDALISVIPVAVVLTVLLLFICYKTGEKPRWRWGK